MYKQVRLRYHDGSFGTQWIEEKYAKKGKTLKDKELDLYCTVDEVYDDQKVTKEQITTFQKTERNHRKATDI